MVGERRGRKRRRSREEGAAPCQQRASSLPESVENLGGQPRPGQPARNESSMPKHGNSRGGNYGAHRFSIIVENGPRTSLDPKPDLFQAH